MIGLLFVLIALTKKLFSVDYSSLRYVSTIIVLGVLALLLFLLTKYYSTARVDAVLTNFENNEAGTRRLWRFLTVTTLVAEYIVVALLLSK
jgi:hypothetical protein